jgi:hypothetical protein
LVALVPLALCLLVLLSAVAVLNFFAVVLWAVQSAVSPKAVQKLRKKLSCWVSPTKT